MLENLITKKGIATVGALAVLAGCSFVPVLTSNNNKSVVYRFQFLGQQGAVYRENKTFGPDKYTVVLENEGEFSACNLLTDDGKQVLCKGDNYMVRETKND